MISAGALDRLTASLAAISAGDTTTARVLLDGAPEGSLLVTALARYLDRAATGSVYDDPGAFSAFIRGGGNVELYRATSAALASLYDSWRPATAVDIGCGDGLALAPALRSATHPPRRVDLLEPSSALLEQCVRAVGHAAPHVQARPWPEMVQSAVRSLHHHAWDVAQATFALHTLPHPERTGVLVALRAHVGRLAVVEFDVPDVAVGSDSHRRFLATTYEQGLAEYDEDRDLVADGFLMPVLVGQLAPGAVRSTWEQPAAAWAAQCTEAGWLDVTIHPLAPYWSSPAFLLTARGGKGG